MQYKFLDFAGWFPILEWQKPHIILINCNKCNFHFKLDDINLRLRNALPVAFVLAHNSYLIAHNQWDWSILRHIIKSCWRHIAPEKNFRVASVTACRKQPVDGNRIVRCPVLWFLTPFISDDEVRYTISSIQAATHVLEWRIENLTTTSHRRTVPPRIYLQPLP